MLNEAGRKVWRDDGPTSGQCIWEMHGVWGWDRNKNEGIALRENYFKKHPMTNQKVCEIVALIRNDLLTVFPSYRSTGILTFITLS